MSVSGTPPAVMTKLDALMANSLLRALQDAATRAGVPFARITERRWNERGEPIGPRLESRSCEMIEYRILREQVSVLIESTARRMADARSASA